MLRSEVRELENRRENLKDELTELRAQNSNIDYQLRAKRSRIERIMKDRIDSIIHDKELIFFIPFFAMTETLRNHPDIRALLFDLIVSEGVLPGKSVMNNLKNDQFVVSYYSRLLPMYNEYLIKGIEIIHGELMKSYSLVRAQKNN